MSCVPCVECGDGTGLTRENLDRWTDSVSNVLSSTEGRRHFKRFLESRSLDESLYAVEYWERCSRIVSTIPSGGDSPPHVVSEQSTFSARSMPGSSCSSSVDTCLAQQSKSFPAQQRWEVTEGFKEDLQSLVDFADKFVNFDLSQLRSLYQMLRKTNLDDVSETILQSKQATMELLSDDYQLFREHLLESRGLLNK